MLVLTLLVVGKLLKILLEKFITLHTEVAQEAFLWHGTLGCSVYSRDMVNVMLVPGLHA